MKQTIEIPYGEQPLTKEEILEAALYGYICTREGVNTKIRALQEQLKTLAAGKSVLSRYNIHTNKNEPVLDSPQVTMFDTAAPDLKRKRKPLTPEAKARISEAQHKRWEAFRKQKGGKKR